MYEVAQLARVVYTTCREDIRDMLGRVAHMQQEPPAPFAPPPTLQVLKSSWPRTHRFVRVDGMFSRAYFRRLQKRLDVNAHACRVVYAWTPLCLEAVKGLSYDMLIYHPYDMFRHFVDSSHEFVELEDELCRLADAVVTPHGRIADALGHPNTHIVNNGVFLRAFPDCIYPAPRLLAGLGRPIVGNLGVINDKVDFSLLLEVFASRPEWQLAFVGFEGAGAWKTSSAYLELRRLPNVHFLGGVPIDKVAPVVAGFDVGIIPYGISGWAEYIESPLKLYQYWSMGIPAVSSALPKLCSQPGAVEVCSSAEEWRDGIERQLSVRGTEQRRALRAKAEEHSWAGKAEQVVSIISEAARG